MDAKTSDTVDSSLDATSATPAEQQKPSVRRRAQLKPEAASSPAAATAAAAVSIAGSTKMRGNPPSSSPLLQQQREDDAQSSDDDIRSARLARTSSMPRLLRSETSRELNNILNNTHYGPIKWMLLVVPVAILAGVISPPSPVTFLLNFLALLPLSALSILTILVLTKNAGVYGGVLRAVFGNITELALSVTALFHGISRLVLQITIGSTLIYSLFVLGGCFLCASFGKRDAEFSKSRTSLMSSLIMVTTFCLSIPTAMSRSGKGSVQIPIVGSLGKHEETLVLSHLTAVVLFFLFLAYIAFRFLTHDQFFPRNPNAMQFNVSGRAPSLPAGRTQEASMLTLIAVLITSITCTGVCANFVIVSIKPTVDTLHVTQSFIGLVVLPLTASFAKSVTIIRHARSDDNTIVTERMSKLDFAIRSVMTNVLDTLLFIMPMLVLIGWAAHRPMVLLFELFEVVVFVLAIIIMSYLVQHGKTTYFEGCMLMGSYLSIVAAFYVRPESAGSVASAYIPF